MGELITALQQNAPVLVVVGVGFFLVLRALYQIDRRLFRVEVKLWPEREAK
jgi:hypothetical protein